MLKFMINKESFDKLNEVEKTFYAQDGDDYKLQVEGAVSKKSNDGFREKNISQANELERFKGVDLDKYNAFIKNENDIRDKKLIDAGDFDKLLAEKTNTISSDFEAKLSAITEKLDASNSAFTSLQTKHKIDGAMSSAFTEHKIIPDMHKALSAQIKSMFTLDGESVVAKEGEKILTGANGNLTINEFVSGQPEIFKVQSNGGGAKGNDSNNQQPSDRTAAQKIEAGLAELSK